MDYNHRWQNFNRDYGADAPEVVNIISPVTFAPDKESELQTQYRGAHDNVGHTTIHKSDAEKEAVLVGHDSDGMHAVPLEHSYPDYPETSSVLSPQTPWTPSTEYTRRALSDAGKGSLPVNPEEANGGGSRNDKDKRIFGMSLKLFLLLIVVLIIIVAAGIGGGVGGAVASSTKSKSDAASTMHSTPPSSSTSSTPPPASATSSSPTSTSPRSTASPTPSISFLNNQTWPKSSTWAFQGFSRNNYSGSATDITSGVNGNDKAVNLEFDIHSYVWIPNINNCCVNFCSNDTKQGYIGYRCQETRQEVSSEAIARLKIWCSDKQDLTVSKSRGCGD